MSDSDFHVHVKEKQKANDVLIFGKEPSQVISDWQAGLARFGGQWRQPSYLFAYVRSAAILIKEGMASNTLDDIALPCFCLQRHATELFLKRLLGWFHYIAELRQDLGQSGPSPTSDQKGRLNRCHNFDDLVADLVDLSGQFDYGAPPLDIGEFIKLLAKFETTETWSRYSTSGKGGQTKHVEAEVVIPIVKIQHDLENLVNSHLYNLGGNPSYEGDLYSECNFLLEELREKWESEPQQGSQ